MHVYQVRPCKDHCGVNFRCAAIRQLVVWRAERDGNAIDYAKHRSRSHDAVIRVYDAAGNLIETHERKGDFKEP